MLFHSSLRTELARSFGAMLIVLTTVIMTMTLIRTLGQASRGSFNPSEVLLVMGFTVLAYMPTILSMSLFIAIVATLTRMYRDSEMVIWFCSGKGLLGMLGPLFRFAWPILLVITVVTFGLLPWSKAQVEDMKTSYEQRSDLERVEAGRFQESANGSRVFFIDNSASSKQSGSQIFIASTEHGKQSVTSARGGQIQTTGQNSMLLLQMGQRLEQVVGQSDLKISDFEEYGAQIDANTQKIKNYVPPSTLPSWTLLQHPSLPHWAELSWRLGIALAAINFILIALGVSGTNPRVGRSGNLVFAMFTFVLYFNLLNLGQNWVRNGQIHVWNLLILLHGGVFLLALLWLGIRHHNWHPLSWQRRPAARSAH